MVGPTLSLLRSVFGISSMPYTVLRCNVSSTPAELRRAYHAAALRYHPDCALCRRCRDDGGAVAATVAAAEDDDD
jgi:DnaJ-class molecular chaperone